MEAQDIPDDKSFSEVEQLRQRVAALENQAKHFSRTEDKLSKRLKELNCLYSLSKLIGIPEISEAELLQSTLELIPPAYQYPEITCARLLLDGKVFKTKNFKETIWKQTASIVVDKQTTGSLEVFYLKEMPPLDEGPFLKEERDLIDALAKRVGQYLGRKQAEEALRESEENLRLTLNSISDAVIAADLQGRVTGMNPVAEELTGWTFEQAENQPLQDVFKIVNAQTGETVQNLQNQVLETGNVVGLPNHTKLISKHGDEYKITDSGAPIKNINGQISGMVLVFRDVSEGYRIQSELKESEFRFRELFNNMSSSVAVYKAVDNGNDFEFFDFNNAGEQADKISKEELVGKKVTQVFPGVREFGLLDVFKRVYKSGNPEHHPISQYQDDRIVGWRENYVYKLPSGEIVSIYDDITERKQAQDALESNYNLLRIAGKSAKFGGWSVNLSTNKVAWSDAVTDIHETPHGYSPQLEEGINFYAPEWREKITQVFTDCAEKGIPYNEEMEIITSKGKRVWVRTVGEALRDQNGKIVIVQGSFQDISLYNQTKEALQTEREQLLELFDSIEQAINVTDPNSYEILFANRYLKNLFDEDPIGGICYQVFQGFEKPCEFCTNEIIFKEIGKPYTWEHYNPNLGRDYLITDKAIRWVDDRDVRFEIAIDITKQKQAEKEIINREKSISTLINAITDAAFLIDPQGTLLALNDELARRLGKEENELLGTIVYDSLPAEVAKKRRECVKEVLQTGKPVQVNDEREEFILHNTIYPHLDSNGKVSMLAVYSRDITEQVQREHLLNQQRTTLNTLLNAPQDTVALMERDGTLVNINKNGAKRLGKTVDELIGNNIFSQFPEPLAKQRKEIFDKVSETGQEAQFEDSRAGIFLLNSVYPIYAEDGATVDRIAVYAADITERKQAEQELRQLKENLELQVAEKTKELQERVQNLERFHDATIQREIRIKELRDEIEQLKGEKS